MKQFFLVVAALAAGFAGGVFGSHFARIRERPQTERVVRARSFELVDEAGRAISYWGVDKAHNAVLAFSNHWHPARPKGSVPPDHAPKALDDPDNQRLVIGMVGECPFFALRGADGKTRVRLYLSFEAKPMLLMEDETGPRVSLGFEQSDTADPHHDDWSLMFIPERAWLGMHAREADGRRYYRGGFSVNRDWVKHP